MATQQRKPTKTGSLTPAFIQAAARDPDGALSFMLLSAFGITLSALMAIASKAFASQDIHLVIMALTAGVQIRNHVVFVGREFGNIRVAYPELIIEGDREQRDIFNFGALHALGHVFAHVTADALGGKVLAKAGSCITGDKLTESEAGAINREIFNGWTVEDKGAWAAWVADAKAQHAGFINPVVASVPAKARGFSTAMAQPTGPPARPAAARAGAAGSAT